MKKPVLNFSEKSFAKLLLYWNKHHNNREMPWKGESDPYRIWLSEIILQQTRVEQGLSYYHRFLQQFPTITKLAAANDDTVFKLWQGLGYYSRCKNLIKTARLIVNEYHGKFPTDHALLLRLPGVGAYTAAAIASFAFHQPFAVVDGNVYRVISRYFGIKIPVDTPEGKKTFADYAQQLLHKKDPKTYNQALMDFGATVCKPRQPLCDDCVFQKQCYAYQHNKVDAFPVKSKKQLRRKRYFVFFVLMHGNKIMLTQRKEKDIWQNLYQFPMAEHHQPLTPDEAAALLPVAVKSKPLQTIRRSQTLTHQQVESIFLVYKLKSAIALPGAKWYHAEVANSLAMPRVLDNVRQKLFEKS